MGLTHNEAAALAFVQERLRETLIAPSLREIAVALGFSESTKGYVQKIMKALEERGHLHRIPRRSRAIALGPAPTPHRCPHCKKPLEGYRA